MKAIGKSTFEEKAATFFEVFFFGSQPVGHFFKVRFFEI